jgi:hypothetical protein
LLLAGFEIDSGLSPAKSGLQMTERMLSSQALVEKDKADEFMQAWEKAYVAEFPENQKLALFFKMVPGPGACSI